MFTGIVKGVGIISGITKRRGGLTLTVQSPFLRRVAKGSSVSVSGVCLTVAKKKGGSATFDVMEETARKTTLAQKKKGDRVNIERALKVGDELSGHFVYGHVDGIGQVTSYLPTRDHPQGDKLQVTEGLLIIKSPRELMKYIVPQGSIAVDGVSLTIARVGKKDFTVALVDYTLKHTTLGKLKKGDKVNLEVDMLAKYVTQILSHR